MNAKAQKQVAIYVNRNLTLNRRGKDPVKLERGRNVVDADVADHPFIKAHIESDAVAVAGADEALQAKVAELTAAIAERDATIAEQAAMLEAFKATAPKGGK